MRRPTTCAAILTSTATNNKRAKLTWGLLSTVGNRKGYAGYEFDDALADAYQLYHVRNRVLNSDLGQPPPSERAARTSSGYRRGRSTRPRTAQHALPGSTPRSTRS